MGGNVARWFARGLIRNILSNERLRGGFFRWFLLLGRGGGFLRNGLGESSCNRILDYVVVGGGDKGDGGYAFFFASHATLLIGVRFHSDCGYGFSPVSIIALDVLRSIQR